MSAWDDALCQRVGDGGYNRHRMLLVTLIEHYFPPPDPIVFVEVGTFRGETLEHVLQQCENAHMLSVDPWEVQSEEENPNSGYNDKNILCVAREEAYKRCALYEDRCKILEMCSVDAAKKVEDQSIQGVFIDANHKYEYVKQDLEAWYPKVRKGGIFSGHDYGNHEGVKRAVDPFLEEKGLKLNLSGTGWFWWTIK